MPKIKVIPERKVMPKVKVISACTGPPSDDTILFPQDGGYPSDGRVVVTAGGQKIVLNAGLRGDTGNAACVSGSVLKTAGGLDTQGEGPDVEYRRGRWYDVYRYSGWKLAGAIVALFATGASVVLAVIAFTVDSSSTDKATRGTAVVVCLLTIGNVVLTFIRDLSS